MKFEIEKLVWKYNYIKIYFAFILAYLFFNLPLNVFTVYRCYLVQRPGIQNSRVSIFCTCSCWLCGWLTSLKGNKMVVQKGVLKHSKLLKRKTVRVTISESGFCWIQCVNPSQTFRTWFFSPLVTLTKQYQPLTANNACMYDSLPENVTYM